MDERYQLCGNFNECRRCTSVLRYDSDYRRMDLLVVYQPFRFGPDDWRDPVRSFLEAVKNIVPTQVKNKF